MKDLNVLLVMALCFIVSPVLGWSVIGLVIFGFASYFVYSIGVGLFRRINRNQQ